MRKILKQFNGNNVISWRPFQSCLVFAVIGAGHHLKFSLVCISCGFLVSMANKRIKQDSIMVAIIRAEQPKIECMEGLDL